MQSMYVPVLKIFIHHKWWKERTNKNNNKLHEKSTSVSSKSVLT